MVARGWRREALATKGYRECQVGGESWRSSAALVVSDSVNYDPSGSSVRGISPRQEY